MTGDGERRTETKAAERGVDEHPGERDATALRPEREPERVPEPSPEEVPELLGERSDYPIAWDGEAKS